jgi:hypothetical protein
LSLFGGPPLVAAQETGAYHREKVKKMKEKMLLLLHNEYELYIL